MATPRRHDFDDRDALAAALAGDVAAVLAGGIAENGRATLAVSGGATPRRFFAALSKADIDWRSVTVALVDERMVAETDERSNARLVRTLLLTNLASAARFVGLYPQAASIDEAAARAAEAVDALPAPFDAVILGMGTDGHTASFFPGGTTLNDALSPNARASVIPIEAPGAGEPRLTLTFPRLENARFLALHIEGAEKHAVLQRALGDGDEAAMPVRAVLRRASTPVDIYWAP